MTVDATATWLAVGELLDNSGLAGDFDAERERTYRMVLQPWERREALDPDTGQTGPALVIAVLRVLRRPDLRFLPPVGLIAEQCRALAGDPADANAPTPAEAVHQAEHAAYMSARSEADRIAWIRERLGRVAAGWYVAIGGTARIREARLVGDYAGHARRDLEQSYAEYRDKLERLNTLGLPPSPALEQRGTASISELASETGQ